MTALELPHINVLSKVDLLATKSAVERFLDPPIDELVAELATDPGVDARRAALTTAIGSLISDYGMVNFMPLDASDESSIELITMAIDHAVQYHDDVEPREPEDEAEPEDDEGGGFGGAGADDDVGGYGMGGYGGGVLHEGEHEGGSDAGDR